MVPAQRICPFFQHVGPIRHRLSEADILLGEQDRKAGLLELHDGVGNPFDNDRSNPFGWLVKKDELRIAHQRPRNGEHLLFAAAHVAAAAVAHFGEIGE